MLAILLASNITCAEVGVIITRVELDQVLSNQVKAEIIAELKKAVDCYWDANVD